MPEGPPVLDADPVLLCCLCVCLSIALLGVCATPFCVKVPGHVPVCNVPRAWRLLSSPSLAGYISILRVSRSWTLGSLCWPLLDSTVLGGVYAISLKAPDSSGHTSLAPKRLY